MSANNWRRCPKCELNQDKERQKALDEIGATYGKVPSGEWLKKCKEIQSKFGELEESMREDYELSTNDQGRFYVSYCCSCSVCKFKFHFKHQEQINLED